MIKTKQDVFTTPPMAGVMRKFLLLAFLMLVLCGTGWAREIFVDDDSVAEEPDGSEDYPYRLVGNALTCAEGDDTVDIITLLPGTYRENLTLTGFPRNLTIRSTYDPLINTEEVITSTIIQGGEDVFDTVFQLRNCIGQINFWGLSIRNGRGLVDEDMNHLNSWSRGGGICAISDHNIDQTVSVNWCRIYENYACWGGGIYGEHTSFTIENTDIFNNALYFRNEALPSGTHDDYDGPKGGGVYLAGGWSTISKCRIYENRTFLEGTHSLYNPLCYGNASAVFWRFICSINDIGLIMDKCEIYNNVTQTINDQMRSCRWPFRATIQVQRVDDADYVPINPGDEDYHYVEVSQCTITDNKIISETPGPLILL